MSKHFIEKYKSKLPGLEPPPGSGHECVGRELRCAPSHGSRAALKATAVRKGVWAHACVGAHMRGCLVDKGFVGNL